MWVFLPGETFQPLERLKDKHRHRLKSWNGGECSPNIHPVGVFICAQIQTLPQIFLKLTVKLQQQKNPYEKGNLSGTLVVAWGKHASIRNHNPDAQPETLCEGNTGNRQPRSRGLAFTQQVVRVIGCPSRCPRPPPCGKTIHTVPNQ